MANMQENEHIRIDANRVSMILKLRHDADCRRRLVSFAIHQNNFHIIGESK